MHTTREKSGLTEMDNYMREFIVHLRREGKELRTLLPMCEGVKSNKLWNKLLE